MEKKLRLYYQKLEAWKNYKKHQLKGKNDKEKTRIAQNEIMELKSKIVRLKQKMEGVGQNERI